ncbi:MAG: urea ABC transporter ATP-binding protein UrtD [Spirochaetales bacterium]|nr:urea ABC transporter ATP-binding protein UrtD [Spirochaetales bacterium]
MKNDVLYMEAVSVSFDGFKALNNVNLFIKQRELRFLIGPNGAGKTTLLDVICGKTKPDMGRVFYNEEFDLLRMKPSKICKAGISRKFQAPSVFGSLTVEENLRLSIPKNRELFSSFFDNQKGSIETVDEVLETVGLTEKRNWLASQLAHGEKQWLEIGLTIIQKPKLLLVDEPVAGMTGGERDKTGILLTKIAKDCSVIVVEHDMKFVERFSSTVTVLHEGRVISDGSYEKVKKDPYVIDVYLGRDGGKHESAAS